MYSFSCDYSEGAHPQILKALADTNMEQSDGYSLDPHCENAANLIRKRLNCSKSVDIHFFVGGTQTNVTAISAFLKPHHAVISAKSGHIFVHETGAVEATGHKVIALPTENGKILPAQIVNTLEEHEDEHMVKPRLVYLSNSTEIGTIYSKGELTALSKVCKENDLFLYLDGARLASALTCDENDLLLEDIPALVDAFYIGGTKNGALFGEALVICREELKEDFRFHIKQKCGLLAKGRLLGIQFEELFKDDLFFKNSSHANKMAVILQKGIEDLGYDFYTSSPTNQIFPIFSNEVVAKLQEKYSFLIWNKVNNKKSTIRLVTSWATEEQRIHEFLTYLKTLAL